MRGEYAALALTPPVVAEVVLQPLTGTVVDGDDHAPGREELVDTARRLAELGFDIETAGPVAITISGDRELFESTFGDGDPVVPGGLDDVIASVTYT